MIIGNPKNMFYNRIKDGFHGLKKNMNKGFTLVELIVVLALLVILLSVTIVGGLAWQDWAQFRQEEAMAEEIFYAAQNQLTELDSSGALYHKVTQKMQTNGSYKSEYKIDATIFNTIPYDTNSSGNVILNMNNIWINANLTKEPGELVKLQANAGDYEKYLDGDASLTDSAKILFDLVSPYISDKSALNASIIVEFSPEAGQVFSVCYSDRASSLVYSAGSSSGTVSVTNRILQEREKIMLGYYSVDTITQKVRGRGEDVSDLDFRIQNDNVLQFIIYDGNNEIQSNDKLIFNVYDGNSNKKALMTFEVTPDSIPDVSSIQEGLNKDPQIVTVKFANVDEAGKYKGTEDKVFRIPAYKYNNRIYLIMDAADVQAQTLAYRDSIYFDDSSEDGKNAFRNTFSFYRFGLSQNVNYIYGDVSVWHSAENVTADPCDSRNMAGDKHCEANGGIKGECTTFASYKKENNDVNIEISNMRHFYNVRYETDYKTNKDICNTFKLASDLSWKSFVGDGGGVNYYLNSYTVTPEYKSGINYSGANTSTSISGTDTSKYAFPGFRKLDKNDTLVVEDGKNYAISDLTISITGNITYGVYGKAIKNACASEYSSTQGTNAYSDYYSTDNNAARAGEMPLGLFAENQGTITNVTLNRHVVKGLEEDANKNLVYTCMVGGFAGNNLGTISKLTLLDNVENNAESDKANISKINGRTDVGGIIGRQSFVVSGKEQDVTISDMKNYAAVSGLENIGGIVGRAYTRFVDGREVPRAKSTFASLYSGVLYKGASINSYEKILYRYYNYHDGYKITDTYKSMTGEDVDRNGTITISDCENRGVVSGDDLAYKYLVGQNIWSVQENQLKTVTIKGCAFIGGIAGITMDGYIYDDTDLTYNNKHLFVNKCSDYINGEKANVIVKECNSYVVREDSIVSDLIDSGKNKSVLYDNYVGGLIGYSKLTAIENCNSKPDADMDTDNDGVANVYVVGNRYVGGIAGCADMTRIDIGSATVNNDGLQNKKYGATNYNNVIGHLFVGGIFGGNGIGDNDQETFDYRNPSINELSFVSQIKDAPNTFGSSDLLNTGVVLSLYNSDFYADYSNQSSYSGYCGGIVGANRSVINNCDNIQNDSVKNLIMKITSGRDSVDYYGTDGFAAFSTDILKNTNKFGGTYCGGIVGYNYEWGYVNTKADTSSSVDAVVYGQAFVGGAIGGSGAFDNQRIKANNFYPVKENDSKGLLVLGLDGVGGIAGKNPSTMVNDDLISAPYIVMGRNNVGGVLGVCIDNNCKSYISVDVKNGKTYVYGKGYVGGEVGYVISSAANIYGANISSGSTEKKDLNGVSVEGDFYVGGLAGAVADKATKDNKTDTTCNKLRFVKNLTVGDVSVNAHCFAGGITGLYYIAKHDLGVGDMFIARTSTYKMLSERCKADLKTTYTNVVKTDIDSGAPFWKNTDAICEIDFGDYGQSNKYTNVVNVTSDLFAGGLAGYIPNNQNIIIKGFVNNGAINVNKSIAASTVAESADKSANTTYSYLGGVVGRIPPKMKVVNCANLKNGDDYNSKGTYLGGLAEVNAGTVSGDITTAIDGSVTVNSYIENNTDFVYNSGGVGAFVGVNGTTATGCAGVIQYARNNAKITSNNGFAGGIAASNGGASTIKYAVNLGDITSNKSAGIVVNPSGTDTINHCRNYGKIFGSTVYGIAAGTVGTVTKNLEASGLDDSSTDPVANMASANLVRNFFISGTKEASSGGSTDTPGVNKGTVYYTSDNVQALNRKKDYTTPISLATLDTTNNTYELSFDVNASNGGIYMKSLNIIWQGDSDTYDKTYIYDVVLTCQTTAVSENSYSFRARKVEVKGTTATEDTMDIPSDYQNLKITKITIKFNDYNAAMAAIDGADCELLYGCLYWTDDKGEHFMVDGATDTSGVQNVDVLLDESTTPSQPVVADHWSKQLFVQNQSGGNKNLVYTKNGALMTPILSAEDEFTIDPNDASTTASQRYEAFDEWFLTFADDETNYSNGMFVDP